eukprot:tig00000940_g5550.t1
MKDGAPVDTVPGSSTSTSVSDLPRDGVATLSVVPTGPGGAPGTASAPLSVGVPSSPGAGITLTATPASASSARLAWNRPQGALAPPRNRDRARDGADTNTFTATGLQPNAPAAFSVVPLSPSGAPSGPASRKSPSRQLPDREGRRFRRHRPGSKTSATVSDLPRGGVANLSVVPISPGGAAGTPSPSLAAGIPSNPGSGLVLTATPASASSAKLAWNRPQGGAGAPASYSVLQNGQPVATVPATGETNSFVATGLQPGVPAVFSVVPLSPSGSPSGPASVQVPVTPASGLGGAGSPGAGAPSAPSNVQLTNVSTGLLGGTSGTLSWNHPATGAPQSYQIMKDGAPVDTVPGSSTSTSVSDLPRDGVATLSVVPMGPGGAPGTASAPLSVGVPSSPGAGITLTATPASASSARLAWNRPQGGAGPTSQFAVLKNGQQIATVPATGADTNTFTATGLQPNAPRPSRCSRACRPRAEAAPRAPSRGAAGDGAPQSYQIVKDGVSVGTVPGSKTSATVSDLPRGGVANLSVVPISPVALRALRRRGAGAPASYSVLQNGQPVATVPATGETNSFVATGLQPGVPAVFSVVPLSPSGSPSGPASVQVPVTPASGLGGAGSPGAGALSAPSNVQLTNVSTGLLGGTSGTLSWNHPATGAPQSYQIMKDGAPSTPVVPMGPGGAPGTASAPLSVGVPSSPGAGITLTATPASASSARLAFAVLKNGQQIATVPATGADTNTFTATGLQPNAPAAFSVVPLSPSGAPSGPASPQVPVTPASGTLSWSPPATGAPQSYQIVKDGVSVGTVPGSKTSATVSDLPRGGVANLSVVPISPGGAAGTPSPSLAAGIPSNPGSGLVLTATPASASSAKLAWNRPQGGAGAPASYSVLQNGQPVATVPATGETNSFVATGLQPGVPAVFSVVPLSPSGSPSGPASVQSYQIMKDGAPVDTVPGSSTSTSVSDLPRDGVATLSVVPMGPGGAPGTASAPLSVGVPSSPGAGITLTATPASASSARLAWNRPQGGAGPTSQFAVLKNGQQIATVPATGADTNTFTATGLQPNAPRPSRWCRSRRRARRAARPARKSPSRPHERVALGRKQRSGTLSWSPPATGAPQSYQIVKDGVSVGTVPGSKTSATVSDLPRGGVANLSVVPISPGGAAGTPSPSLAAGIPSNPGSGLVLTATPASASSAKLAWNRPQGGAGAPASYSVLQNGQPVATVPATGETNSFVATGLQPGVPAVFSVVPLSPSGSPSGPASVQVPVTPASGLGGAGSPGAGALSAPSNVQLTNVSTGLLAAPRAPSRGTTRRRAPAELPDHEGRRPVDTVPGSSTSTSVSDLPRDGVATLSVVPMGPGGAPGTASAPLSVGVPSSPGAGITLTATPASASSARLAWNRPQGGAGPTSQFAVLKNGQQIATVPATGADTNTFTATGLQPNAPAAFSVVPLSPSGAPSGPASPQVPVTPYAGAGGAGFGPGASSPSAPSNLQLTSVSPSGGSSASGTLSWSPPATGAPQSYQIVKDGVSVGTVPGSKTSATVSDLPRGGVANLSVVPISPGGAAGTPSPSLAAGIPSNPGSGLVLTATPASASSAKLAWNRPQGGAGAPASYSVLQNGQPVATVPATGETNSFVATGLQPGVPAVFSVVPLSPSGSPSGPASVQVPVTPASGLGGAGSPGAGALSAPSNVQLTNVSTGLLGGTSGTLSWNHPATGAPQSYQIMKDGAPVDTVPGSSTSTSVSDLPRDGVATLSVVPMGPGGAPGTASAPLSVGVPSSPGAGITLTATPASASSARLAWNRPQGGAGPTSQFAVLKNGQQIATVPATGADTNTFTATGLQPNAPAAFSVVPLSPSGAPSGPASPQVPVTPASGTLSWSPPATGAPQSYQIVKDGVSVGTVPGSKTSATVSDLPRGGVANLSVVPISPGGAAGTPSPSLAAGIPSNPGSGLVLTATPASASSAKLAWNRPQGGAGAPASYSVLQNGQPVATVPATGETNSFVATGLQPGVPAVFSVVPLSPSGSPSGPASVQVPVTPASGLGGAGSPGAGALSAPSNVQLTNVSTGLLGGTSGTLS